MKPLGSSLAVPVQVCASYRPLARPVRDFESRHIGSGKAPNQHRFPPNPPGQRDCQRPQSTKAVMKR